MIILNKNMINSVIIRDGVKPISLNYLFVAYNKDKEVVKYFQVFNNSSYPEYIKFLIDEDIDENRITGKVYFQGNTMDYEYKVFYLTGYIDSDVGLENAFNTVNDDYLVSEGILRIMSEEQSTIDEIYL